MNILGISCFYHDAAVALLRDGVLVAAAEEERFTRKKHDYSFPKRAIEFCLQQAQIKSGDLDYVVFYEKPLVKFERILMTCLGAYPKTWRVFREAMITWFNEKLWIKGLMVRHLGLPENKILFAPHHMSHAASALYCSPFKEAALLTIDGVGEWTTAAIGRGTADWNNGTNNAIDLFGEIRFPHSLGLLYSAFTAFLGFEVNEGEYKVMGMAPYGEPRYMDEAYKLIRVGDDGSFRLNMEYFSFYHSTDHTFNQRFVDLFGAPRKRESEFYTATTHPQRDHPKWDNQVAADNQKYADIAASIQRVTEDIILKMANHVQRVTGSKQLCMAGGVALNSVANGRILRETAFEDVFIQPAAGDSGGALGAALYTYHVLLKKPRRFVLENCYWGAGYSNGEIVDALQAKGLAFEEISDDNRLVERVADGLTQGKVVGWFQGRFEWGPRALGNRSILADPRRGEMKGIVNEKNKIPRTVPSLRAGHSRRAHARISRVDGSATPLPGAFYAPGRADSPGQARSDPGGESSRHRAIANDSPRHQSALLRRCRKIRRGDRRAGVDEHLVQLARRANCRHARERDLDIHEQWSGLARPRKFSRHQKDIVVRAFSPHLRLEKPRHKLGGTMSAWLKGLAANTGFLGDIFVFLWKRKMWWLIPMVVMLVIFGLLLLFASASGVGPFIYSLF